MEKIKLFGNNMDRILLNKIKEEVLSIPLEPKSKNNDFTGVYLHSNSPFKLEDHLGPIHSFNVFSKYEYPIEFFISPESINKDFEVLLEKYPNITPTLIPKLESIIDFNYFSIYELPHRIRGENLLYFQEDSSFIKHGFEKLCHDYDWIGAPWAERLKVDENVFNFDWVQVGNGGICFRRRSKCLEVLKLVEKYGGQDKIVKGLIIEGKHRTYNSFLAEDAFFCYFGFGSGIFKSISTEIAKQFSLEPITYKQFKEKRSFAFHRVDSYE